MTELLYAMAPGGQGTGSSGMLSLLPFILIFFVIYFLMIRPQVKKQKELKIMLENLNKGNKVLTTGGIIGIIVGFKDKENIVILKIDQNVKIEVFKTSITRVLSKE